MLSRRLYLRILNFLRPAPIFKPLTPTEILGDQHALSVVDAFRDLYYRSGVATHLQWRGTRILKNPCDLWMTIELIQRIRPATIVETGTHEGGSALFFADISRLLGLTTTVITVDPNPKWSIDPKSAGIVSIRGYSTDPKMFDRVRAELRTNVPSGPPSPVMVFLDSDHSAANVLAELRLYSSLVTPNSFLVVEDTIVNGHPSYREHGPGPWEAVEQFLEETTSFEVDKDSERFLLTYNPSGWLRRIE